MDKTDYREPPCLLAMDDGNRPAAETPHGTIPLAGVIAECDRLAGNEDMASLGDHLRFWRKKAHECGDKKSELSLLNELMGYYRMTGDPERGIPVVRDGLSLLKELHCADTASGGTILLNAATALKAFGDTQESLTCYAAASRAYGRSLAPGDKRFAGLFNNMAAAYLDNGEIRHAEVYYEKALDILKQCGNLPDRAVTYVNLAQLYHQIDPEDPRIEENLHLATACFDAPGAVRDHYYAHTCRKVAPAYGFLGFFADEAELNRRADEIYARN
ncbi:MAG: tetratricopeptide repeat protein [Victivallaceae bacterium]|nr:tetratricopeptide repeat protein [Victivallaceae bacterium]